MEILTQRIGGDVEVKVKGRLDAYWADHLRSSLEEVIRGGAHSVVLNMAGVHYLSSAGVGLLTMFHKQLNGIDGRFVVANPSEHVKRILDLCGLSTLLLSASEPVATPSRAPEVHRVETAGGTFDVTQCAAGAALRCELIGDPDPLFAAKFDAQHCRTVAFPPSAFGLGVGAFADDFEDGQRRFGEFLALAGAAAYLPTDGANVPDYIVSSGTLVPEVRLLYGVKLDGGFQQVATFEARGAADSLTLSDIMEACLDVSGGSAAGVAMIAESAGLVGAALRRSPAFEASSTSRFAYPEVREWLSFSTERLYPRSLAVVAGIAARSAAPELAPMLRPLGTAPWPQGHFHAAAFSYRPLKKGEIDLKRTVGMLFENENLQAVIHLLGDDREGAGQQQSRFIRGACWIGAIHPADVRHA